MYSTTKVKPLQVFPVPQQTNCLAAVVSTQEISQPQGESMIPSYNMDGYTPLSKFLVIMHHIC